MILDLAGLKRKSRAEDSDNTDVEEDANESQKTRRKVDHSTSHPSYVLKGNHGSNPVTFPHGEASSSDSANNFYNNSALMQVETSKRKIAEANLEKFDYASMIGDEESDDAESAIWRNKDYENEERTTPSIIQRKLLEIMAASKSFLPNEVVVKIFEAMIRLPREPDSPPTSNQNSESTLHSIEDEDHSDLDIDTNGE
ncbi:hypothetical protein BCON_1260g00020 [Botryotinia convoluta]|uniref:Uncharacterized protein n=1 Tax=Botryotinia convoluta TaxID=54673 RepID=A0A4Z1H3P4_9HELO|nr:hypothetical protein BCON_1260g00020 [Botryotinia convoluta]